MTKCDLRSSKIVQSSDIQKDINKIAHLQLLEMIFPVYPNKSKSLKGLWNHYLHTKFVSITSVYTCMIYTCFYVWTWLTFWDTTELWLIGKLYICNITLFFCHQCNHRSLLWHKRMSQFWIFFAKNNSQLSQFYIFWVVMVLWQRWRCWWKLLLC